MRYILIGIMLLGIFPAGCGRRGPDVAVINIDEIFKSYDKYKAIHGGLEKERNELEAKGQQMLDEINALVKEAELLSEEARREREQRIREKSAQLEAYRMGATRTLMEKTNEKYRALMDEVRVAAEAVAKRRRLGLILDSATAPYSAKSLDVTGEVVDELNRRFQAKPAAQTG